jgi:chromosome partitioning protein
VLANRVKPTPQALKTFRIFSIKLSMNRPPGFQNAPLIAGDAWPEYFCKTQKNYLSMQAQWQPLLNAIIDDPSNWF